MSLHKLVSVEKLVIHYLKGMTHIPEVEEENFLDALKDTLDITEEETGCEICGTTPDETCEHLETT